VQLPHVVTGEFPQQDPQRRQGVHFAEHPFHATGPDNVQVVDGIGAREQAPDDRGQLRCGVRRSGPDSFAAEHHVPVKPVREPGLFGQFHDRDQPGAGPRILVIEQARLSG